MSLTIGIVGLPNVGKSTLFNALTKKSVLAANYPFATIDPSVGVVTVPDDRINQLAAFTGSEKVIPAYVEFVDIAGLVKGAADGEGLGNKFLSHIREVDAIVQVVRIFEDGSIIHVNNKVDPRGDIETINLELAIADKDTVDKRLSNLQKEVKKGDKLAIAECAALEKIKAQLDAGQLAQKADLTDEEKKIVQSAHLLTMKPILYALNKKSGGTNLDEQNDPRFADLLTFIKNEKAGYVVIDAKIEDELKEMSGEDKAVFREDLGMKDDGINSLIKEGYDLLGLMTYFTTGPMETRAWTIKKNSTAPVAGMAIHTDFKDKFIRAEVVGWKELLDAGTFGKAREAGLVRTEGKEYIVKDGDVIEFKV